MKTKKKILIGLVIIAIIAVVGLISCSYTPILSGEEEVKQYTLHSMTYELPVNWKLKKEESSDVSQRFYWSHDGYKYALLEVKYVRDTDLTETDTSAEENYEEISEEDAKSSLVETVNNPDKQDTIIEADNSEFSLEIWCDTNTVKGREKAFDAIEKSFDVDGYVNPRKPTGEVEIEYTGSKEEGTVIDENNTDFTVREEVDTGVAKGYIEREDGWKVKKAVKLKAKKKSTVVIIFNEKEYKIEIVGEKPIEDDYEDDDDYDYDYGSNDSGSYNNNNYDDWDTDNNGEADWHDVDTDNDGDVSSDEMNNYMDNWEKETNNGY